MRTITGWVVNALTLCALQGLQIAAVNATEVVEWRNVPVSIVLTVGEERILAFPDHVQVGVPASLNAGLLRTQSTGGTVLWLARAPFETQRVQVRLLNKGQVLLFDVTAVKAPNAHDSEPIQVRLPDRSADAGAAQRAAALTPVALTRFAAQQLYAPRRLLDPMPGIRRVPMGATATVPLYRDEEVVAEPLVSWQGGGLYVTAVKLTNRGTSRVSLDPRRLDGHFVSAAFQHNTLGSAGSISESTCVYLVTNKPFAASLFPAVVANAGSAESKD
jgi:integrating conjugative element protein (TIGR03749 family)